MIFEKNNNKLLNTLIHSSIKNEPYPHANKG